jgi:ketosteroid isomerase-like protein
MLTLILAGVTLSSLALLVVGDDVRAMERLAQAERDFAARCSRVGFRQSFLENFSRTGVFFSPAPNIAVADLKKQPEERLPLTYLLEWAPETGDISSAGDMGYTTGPMRTGPVDGSKPPGFGYYFSVWEKESKDEPWKVVLDFGTRTDAEQTLPAKVRFQAAADIGRATKKPGANLEELIEAERVFAQQSKVVPFEAVFEAVASPNCRVHRNGPNPALGMAAAKPLLTGVGFVSEWVAAGGGVSDSGDLAYTYGRYTLASPSEAPTKGFFARVWKRDMSGQWRIVADIANTASAPK